MKHISGHGRGRGLGAPTLNLMGDPGFEQGVYALWVEALGLRCRAVAHYGGRPTFGESDPVLEVHVIDSWPSEWDTCDDFEVSGPIFLRPVQFFDSPELLKEQIQKDIQDAQKSL